MTLEDQGYKLDTWKDKDGFWNANILFKGLTVAYASFTYEYQPNKEESHLEPSAVKGWDLFVHPDHRRKGLATAMYLEIKKQSGLNVVQGTTIPDGTKFWEHLEKKLNQ